MPAQICNYKQLMHSIVMHVAFNQTNTTFSNLSTFHRFDQSSNKDLEVIYVQFVQLEY